MADLLHFDAKICFTAGGMLIHQNKVLLIKHKKLGIWLCPGGHVELDEVPHKAAEREFWEETGIRVEAIDPVGSLREAAKSQYVPNPLESHLHWISEENYRARLSSSTPEKRVSTTLWPLGCEQHIGFVYLVRPLGSLTLHQNKTETDDIQWFTQEEVQKLPDKTALFELKAEISHGFEVIATLQ